MIFVYKGIDSSGRRLKDKIEAESIDEAKKKLKAQQVIYEHISEDSPSMFESITFSRRYRISTKELAQLSRELAMYIRSGISIVGALQVVQTQYTHNKKLHLFLKSLNTYLDEGKNFYTALEAQNVVILPEFFKQSIKVSESGGILDEVLLELSRFLKEQDRIAKDIKGAFAYPIFMVVISLFMVAFMLAFVVPQITGIFSSMDQELPKVTQIVISAGSFFSENYALLLGILFSIAAGYSMAYKYIGSFRYLMDGTLLKTPLFGDIATKNELGRFAFIGALLVRSGVPFVQTIDLASKILENDVLRKNFREAANKVVEGKRLSTALKESHLHIDEGFIQSIALGEETSQVEPVLVNLAELYVEENRDKMGMLLTLLEPALMLFVGGMIGFIVAAMLLPIFSMSIS